MSLDIWLDDGITDIGDFNYTHNVTPMWKKAGVYDALYNSEGKEALEILPVLHSGINHMVVNQDEYLGLNPDNGWGDYEGALSFLIEFSECCAEYPKAVIGLSK